MGQELGLRLFERRPSSFAEHRCLAQINSRLQQLIRDQLAHADIAKIEVQLPGEPHPWMAFVGTWKDRPDLAEFEQNIRDYRRQIDADPDRP